MEIPEAYIGQNQKLPARIIIHRLTDNQTQTRLKNQAIREKKKGIKEKSKHLMGMNVYITNTSPEEVPTDYVHSLYSLRWQIEILFKTWKSFFEIDEAKQLKKNALSAIYMANLWAFTSVLLPCFKCGSYCLKRKSRS